jgi:integrase
VAGKRGNGEGAISRRKDGRWEGRYTTESNRRSVYGKTKREIAQKLARTISGKEHAPAFFLPTNVTVAEFFTQYEDAVTDMMKRRSFETCCKVARVHLLPAFGGLRLKELNCEHVQRLYSRKRDAGLSAARARRIHGVLSSALNHAVRWRLVEHNVCKEVSPPRVPPPQIRPLSLEEAKRFLAAAESDRYHTLYVLGLTSGMRLGEVGGLFFSGLGLSCRVLHVQRALITGYGKQTLEAPKTSGSRRNIGLANLAVGRSLGEGVGLEGTFYSLLAPQ